MMVEVLLGLSEVSQGEKPIAMSQSAGSYAPGGFAGQRGSMPHPTYVFEGLFFGKSSEPGPAHLAPFAQHQGGPVCSTPGNHSLILAPAATGKFAKVCAASLLRGYLGSSALVIDRKGEAAAVTARARQSAFPGFNSKVHILNPWGVLAPTFEGLGFVPATYNPLDILDRRDKNVVEHAKAIAAVICPAERGTDNFWSHTAANILTAVLLWITDNPNEQKTLARAREILSLGREDFTKNFLLRMGAANAFGGMIRELSEPFIKLAPETYSGVMNYLAHHTKFLADPLLKISTATSSFSMTDLMDAPTTVYVVIPPAQMQAQGTWLRLVITAGVQTYKHKRRGASDSKKRCLFLIDNFTALGRFDAIPDNIAMMAGYGIDFGLAVQSIQQLEEVYGPAHNTILSNCAYKWFCNIIDLHSADYLSKALGKQTVGQGGSGQPLLTPQEIILDLGRDTAILLVPGGKPHYLRTVDYWDLPEAFAHIKENYPALYWEPPLQYEPNP